MVKNVLIKRIQLIYQGMPKGCQREIESKQHDFIAVSTTADEQK